ncbi:MAG: alpha/beta hydrolase [Acetobacteraceae bacterium]|nr:alpha/beta hydrolase [Acetobacteraceae bacterium]
MSPDAVALRPGLATRRLSTRSGPVPYWAGAGADAAPAVLLLHGAACGAWVWAGGFADALAAAGLRVAAPDLPNGQGATLADRLRVARDAMAALGGPVVLVGHSLGALLAQRLAPEPQAVAQVLLAPVPPEGLLPCNLRLLAADPALWRLLARLDAPPGEAPPELAGALFGPLMPPESARRVLARLGGESRAALIEAQAPQPVPPGWAVGCPAFVLSGDADRLIPPDAAWRCALWHGTVPGFLPGAGHLLMLEPGWPALAARILQAVAAVRAAPRRRAEETDAWRSTSPR